MGWVVLGLRKPAIEMEKMEVLGKPLGKLRESMVTSISVEETAEQVRDLRVRSCWQDVLTRLRLEMVI